MVKNRLELAAYFGELGFKKGAEIGVLEAHYSLALLARIPGLKLFCIDNWKNIPDRDNKEATARRRLMGLNTKIIKLHSMDAVKKFKKGSLDFVYIDANHQYHSVRDDVREWTEKVRIGGIVSGDDFYEIPGSKWGVIPAVDDYIHQQGYTLYITGWDKTIPEEDSHPQWFFIKDH